MADNVNIKDASGATVPVAADDIGAGVEVQRVKAVLGADGTGADPVGVSAGQDSTGAGVAAVGPLMQFDDASTAAVTENQFAPPRISSRRAQLVEGVASGTPLGVTPAAGELHLGIVHGSTVEVATEVTRTADTNAYAVNDAVNNSVSAPTIITFAAASRVASGTGYITKARLSTDQSTCVAQIRLWLFSVSNPTLTNDNALFIIKYADKLTRIGYIDFPALSTETGSGVDTASAFAPDVRIAFVADSSSAIYGMLETKTAFTPASAQKFHLALTFEQN